MKTRLKFFIVDRIKKVICMKEAADETSKVIERVFAAELFPFEVKQFASSF